MQLSYCADLVLMNTFFSYNLSPSLENNFDALFPWVKTANAYIICPLVSCAPSGILWKLGRCSYATATLHCAGSLYIQIQTMNCIISSVYCVEKKRMKCPKSNQHLGSGPDSRPCPVEHRREIPSIRPSVCP